MARIDFNIIELNINIFRNIFYSICNFILHCGSNCKFNFRLFMIFEKKKPVSELFEVYYNDIFNYSLSILKDSDDAKDAVQEVFMRHLKSENVFRGECSYKTWLLTLTRNYCYKKQRNKSHKLQMVDENPAIAYEMNIDTKISLNDAIEGLSVDEYELFYLREYAGYSYQEIAAILKLSLENVKIKLFRIRQQLRKYLKERR